MYFAWKFRLEVVSPTSEAAYCSADYPYREKEYISDTDGEKLHNFFGTILLLIVSAYNNFQVDKSV